MQQHLFLLSLLLVIHIYSYSTVGQTKSGRPPTTDAMFRVNGAATSRESAKNSEAAKISRQDSKVAIRFYKSGEKYRRAMLFRQAIESFQKAVELDPKYADAHYGLGDAYFNLARWPEAIQYLEQAVKLNPKHQRAYARLGEAYVGSRTDTKSTVQTEKATPAGVSVSLSALPVSNSNTAVEAAAKKLDLTSVYLVGIGDVLDVRLGDASAAQSTLFAVTSSGLLEHPNLPEPIPVSGLTVTEIKSRLEDDLKRRSISENPKVIVGVREHLSHAVLVSGLVMHPGTKLLRREAIPLYVVIADAQPLAEAGRVTLIRHETRDAVSADLAQPAEMNMLVRAGDVITVHPNGKQFFYVGGDVKSPGEKLFRSGLTLTQAILVAGGLVGKAKEAQVARERANGFLEVTTYKFKEINKGKLADPSIQPGDRITVVD